MLTAISDTLMIAGPNSHLLIGCFMKSCCIVECRLGVIYMLSFCILLVCLEPLQFSDTTGLRDINVHCNKLKTNNNTRGRPLLNVQHGIHSNSSSEILTHSVITTFLLIYVIQVRLFLVNYRWCGWRIVPAAPSLRTKLYFCYWTLGHSLLHGIGIVCCLGLEWFGV